MIGENLQILRKRKGLTQEQLAEELGVSRQAVSKWETGEAYPETETLLKLCTLYNVSADDLLRGNVPNSSVRLKVKEEADRFSVLISLGVFLILIGVACCVLLSGFAEYYADSRLNVIGAACVLLFIAVAVFLFVYGGITHENYKKQNNEKGVSEEVQVRFMRKFPIVMASLVAGIILFTVFLILATTLFVDEDTPKGALIACIVTAVFFAGIGLCVGGLTLVGIRHAQYLGKEGHTGGANHMGPAGLRERVTGAVCGAIMMTATLVFLLCGFLGGFWHPAWVAFPVGGILCGIVSAVVGAFNKDE